MGDKKVTHGPGAADVKKTALGIMMLLDVLGIGGPDFVGHAVGLDMGHGHDGKLEPFGGVQG